MASVTINGKTIVVPDGTNVVIRSQDIYILAIP